METNRKCWLVGYTLPQCERTLKVKLQQMGVDNFLPMRKETRSWSDRKKTIDVPVFPNYIFIHTTLAKRWELLKIRELIKYVAFDNTPAMIKDDEMALLKLVQEHETEVTIIPQRHPMPTGTKVTINSGKFLGAKGSLLRDEDKNKVIVELTAVRHFLKLHVDADQVTPDFVL